MKFLPIFVVVLCLSSLVLSEEEHKERPDDKRRPPREMSVFNCQPKRLEARLLSNTDGAAGAISFQFSTEGFARWRAVTFAKRSDSDRSKPGVLSTFRFGLRALIEFNDTNNNGWDSTDTVLKAQSMIGKGLRWSDITCNKDVEPKSFTTTFSNIGGVSVKVNGFLAINQTTIVDQYFNYTIGPNRHKIDITVENWPWTNNAFSKLAVVVALESQTPAAEDASKDFSTGNGNLLTWSGSVAGDNTLYQVLSSGVKPAVSASVDENQDDVNTPNAGDKDDDKDASEARRWVIFTFNTVDNNGLVAHPAKLWWDPTIMVEDTTSAAAHVTASVFAVICAIFMAMTL